MDNFYKPLDVNAQELAFQRWDTPDNYLCCYWIRQTNFIYSKYDFDSPKAIDMDLVVQVLTDLRQGWVLNLSSHIYFESDTVIN